MENYYTLVSWNVDNYNDDIHKWLSLLISLNKPDIIFLSEIKKDPNVILSFFSVFTEYNYIINSNIPSKWHGVAMLIRKDHSYEQIQINMGIHSRKDTQDKEAATGRVIAVRIGTNSNKINIIGSYTPNSGRTDQEKLNYRVNIWDPAFARILENLRSQGPTLWMGDINVALNDIDVSNPKTMKKYSGFTPEERANLNILLCTGCWIDIWRHQNPNRIEYSWLGYPHRADHGMRLNNIIVSDSLLPQMLNAFILSPSPESSDHAPIGVYVSK
jgi:exodeoxyribonuclease-3